MAIPIRKHQIPTKKKKSKSGMVTYLEFLSSHLTVHYLTTMKSSHFQIGVIDPLDILPVFENGVIVSFIGGESRGNGPSCHQYHLTEAFLHRP